MDHCLTKTLVPERLESTIWVAMREASSEWSNAFNAPLRGRATFPPAWHPAKRFTKRIWVWGHRPWYLYKIQGETYMLVHPNSAGFTLDLV